MLGSNFTQMDSYELLKNSGPDAAHCVPFKSLTHSILHFSTANEDRLCGLVVRVRFTALAEKKSSGSGTGSTQPREYD
jgi:hypothetical protein